MERRLYIDFETRSEVDLKNVGGALYAEHPSTQIMCIGYKFAPSGSYTITVPNDSGRLDDLSLWEAAADPNVIFVAHNAPFEQAIWAEIMVKRYGYPEVPIRRWRCTMAKALASGLPGSLAQAAALLCLEAKKDLDGRDNMLKLSKPRRGEERWYTPRNSPEEFRKLYLYCTQDVRVCEQLDAELRDLSPKEQLVWCIDQRINQQGVYVDLDAIDKAIAFASAQKAIAMAEFAEDTNGEVSSPTRRKKLQEWLKLNGVDLKDTKKSTVLKALSDDMFMSPAAKRVLEASIAMNKTSLAKYTKMKSAARSRDGLLRGMFAYYGAHTGRWAGRLVQLHNLPRPKVDINTAVATMLAGSFWLFAFNYANITEALSSSIRGMIIAPPGKRLFVGDYSAIEACVLPWLAGDDAKLQLFRDKVDIYLRAATTIYGYPCTDKHTHALERLVGKVAELALGYGGGIGAFVKMAEAYGVDLSVIFESLWESATPLEKANAVKAYNQYCARCEKYGIDKAPIQVGYTADIIKQRWRANNPLVVKFWKDLERAAEEAISTKQPVSCGKLTFFMHRQFLVCKLPSGRCVFYPYPKISVKPNRPGLVDEEDGDYPEDEDAWQKPQLSYIRGIRGRIWTYGGSLSENFTQAVARDILVDAMIRMEPIYPWCMHVHDEGVAYVSEGYGSLKEFKELMEKREVWSETIPISVEAWEGYRYGKG